MITPISFRTYQPSFGMAKLTEKGKEVAQQSGQAPNHYLNGALFEKPRFFSPAQISKQLKPENASFARICENYGCSNNPKTNADFINNQVLSRKGQDAISRNQISEDDFADGIRSLLQYNYDNPYLSKESCEKLLDMVKHSISTDEYKMYAGILRDSE